MAAPNKLSPGLKLTLDIGPLVLFFIANARFGIFTATAVFMAAALLAIATGYLLTRRVEIMTVVTVVIVLVFGSLTLVFHNDEFIKLKPTIIYVLFGGALLGGLLLGKPLLGLLLGQVFDITEEGWRRLTWRWTIFFFALAALNEIVWRNFSTDFWVSFKVFGVVPLTFLFGALQYPLIVKYKRSADEQS